MIRSQRPEVPFRELIESLRPGELLFGLYDTGDAGKDPEIVHLTSPAELAQMEKYFSSGKFLARSFFALHSSQVESCNNDVITEPAPAMLVDGAERLPAGDPYQ